MEHATIAGNYYLVTSKNGGTVSDATGTLNKPIDAGDQLTVGAPSDKLICDDEEAVIRRVNFKHALAALSLLGGGKSELPEGYEADAAVAESLARAAERGWVLTLQTYTPEGEAAAASTFALRRVWVRRRAEENGTYVAADGSRWQVEWCVDVVGSSPEAEGYEPFRSLEAAVAYWELVPWVDPEAEQEEELLTDHTNGQN